MNRVGSIRADGVACAKVLRQDQATEAPRMAVVLGESGSGKEAGPRPTGLYIWLLT